MSEHPEYVIYQCSCGNYVAETTVDAARVQLAPNVELRGVVMCTAPTHGTCQPEMRRIIVVPA